MSTNFKELLICPRCKTNDLICYYIKGKSKKVFVLKLKCLRHGSFEKKIPKDLDQLYILKEYLFRCVKCGNKTEILRTRTDGPWTLIRMTCPNHKRVPIYYVWRNLLSIIQSGGPTPQIGSPTVEAIPQVQNQKKDNFLPEIIETSRFQDKKVINTSDLSDLSKLNLADLTNEEINSQQPKVGTSSSNHITIPRIEIPKIGIIDDKSKNGTVNEDLEIDDDKKICPECKAIINKKNKFCTACGFRLT